jgi:plasmid replication initiation protein
MGRREPPRGDEQLDLFVAVFTDIPIRDQRDMMERPFFSLSKTPRLKSIEYQVGDTWVEVSANPKFGMATIWDADVLIWAATQLTEARDRGLPTSPLIRLHPYELLRAIRRGTSGTEYRRLRAALERLTHSAVRTSIRAGGKNKFASFHWLESWTEVVDEKTQETRGMTITLPLWLYQGILEQGGVLTIHEDYFLLTGGLERWLYRVARKHAGKQPMGWQFTMRQLYEKSGSLARPSDFALDVRKVATTDHLPEYALELGRNGEGTEVLYIMPRKSLLAEDPRSQPPRHPRRRVMRGIYSEPLKLPSATTQELGRPTIVLSGVIGGGDADSEAEF